VNAGTYTFFANPEANTASLSLTATGSTANVLFNPTTSTLVQLAGLTLIGGANAQLVSLGALRTENNERVLVIGVPGATAAPTLSISPSSTLDLTDNDLIDLYGTGSTPYTAILGQITKAYDSGKWDHPGITSSVAASNSAEYGLGYAEASALGETTFDGVTLGGNAVLVKFTLLGDTQLRGSVGLSDLLTVQSNLDGNGTDWSQGNFHYGSGTGLSDLLATEANLNGTLDGNLVSANVAPTENVSTDDVTASPSPAPAIAHPIAAKKSLHVHKLNAKGKVIASSNLSSKTAPRHTGTA